MSFRAPGAGESRALFPPLSRIGEMLRAGETSCVALARQSLERIAARDASQHAFVDVHADQALESARAADALLAAGHVLGPLHGVPVALKDNVDVRGHVTTAGSVLRTAERATDDAWITRRLLECGAVIVGKTHMVEFALGGWGTNEHMGTPRNPWSDAQHLSPGGSSSGSGVAVAAGMVPLAIGTDTGGSVRVPAALCGIAGLKPTIGALSTEGVVPLSTTLDSVGLLAPTADDAALAFFALTGAPAADPAQAHLRDARIGYLDAEHLLGVQPEVLEAYRWCGEVLERAGAHLRPLAMPASFDEIARVADSIITAEAAASWGHLAADEALRMDSSVRRRMLYGAGLSAVQYVQACRTRERWKRQLKDAMAMLDVFVTPAAPWTARPIGSLDHGRSPIRYTRVGNLLDLCAISVPVGFDGDGLPIGLQIVGPTDADVRVLAIAQALGRAITGQG